MNYIKSLYLGLFVALISITSCKEDVLPDNFTHRIQRTQCADPWGHDTDENKLFDEVKSYLKDKDIEVLEINKFSVNVGAVCLACTCPGDEELKIKVSEADGKKLLDLNENWEAL